MCVWIWPFLHRECQAVIEDFTSLVGSLDILPSSLTADASGVIHQFDNEGYKEVWKFEAHQYAVTSMQYHASKIATGGTDGKTRV